MSFDLCAELRAPLAGGDGESTNADPQIVWSRLSRVGLFGPPAPERFIQCD